MKRKKHTCHCSSTTGGREPEGLGTFFFVVAKSRIIINFFENKFDVKLPRRKVSAVKNFDVRNVERRSVTGHHKSKLCPL